MTTAAAPTVPPPSKMTMTKWLICFIAVIGFAFDIYELLMLPLIARPAILELGGHAAGSAEFKSWQAMLFYIPAVCGGIFGLLGGFLTDLLGRRRVLTWSILLYAMGAFCAGFSTSLPMLLVFRCLVFVGVCVEFVAAVAWLAEIFPHPAQREKVLGITQAFSSIGGLLVAVASGICSAWALSQTYYLWQGGPSLPAVALPSIHMPEFLQSFFGTIKDEHAAWRYTLMSGIIPAIPLILIRPFLPESPVWKEKRAAGTLKRPSIAALFSKELRKTTIVTTVMVALGYGAAFGAIQQFPWMAPGLQEVKDQAKTAGDKAVAAAVAKDPATDAKKQGEIRGRTSRQVEQEAASNVAKVQEVGGLFGRIALAILAVVIISRRKLIRIFLVPGLFAMPIIFGWCALAGMIPAYVGLFVAGFLVVGQFSFWGNYLPRVFPVHLRGTGESFAANVGGRLIGSSFAALTIGLASEGTPQAYAFAAAAVATSVFFLAFIFSFLLPEPKPEMEEQ